MQAKNSSILLTTSIQSLKDGCMVGKTGRNSFRILTMRLNQINSNHKMNNSSLKKQSNLTFVHFYSL